MVGTNISNYMIEHDLVINIKTTEVMLFREKETRAANFMQQTIQTAETV